MYQAAFLFSIVSTLCRVYCTEKNETEYIKIFNSKIING